MQLFIIGLFRSHLTFLSLLKQDNRTFTKGRKSQKTRIVDLTLLERLFLIFQVFKTILVVLLSTSNTVKAQFSRSASEEFDSDGFWSDNFRGMDDMNFDNFEFMPEFDFDSFFRKIDAPPLKEAQERSKNLHSVLKLPKTISLYNNQNDWSWRENSNI